MLSRLHASIAHSTQPVFPPLCSQQGHLTRFLSFGLGLSVTAIEADHTLVAMASKFDGQLLWALEKEKQKKVGALLFEADINLELCLFPPDECHSNIYSPCSSSLVTTWAVTMEIVCVVYQCE